MNKQSLYLFGGALLASTALSTASHAAATLAIGPANGVNTALSATNSKKIATQVFNGNATSDNALTIGKSAGDTVTAVNSVIVMFAFPVTLNPFRVDLDITSGNAAFATPTPTAITYHGSIGGLVASTSAIGCSVQPTGTKIIIQTCNSTNTTSVDAIGILGLSFTSAAGLATSGTSITLGGSVKDGSAASIDTITAANFITSQSGVVSTVSAATSGLTIDNTVTPAFSLVKVNGGGSTALVTLGTIQFSTTTSLALDLSAVVTFSAFSATGVVLKHPVLSDDALASVRLSGTTTTTTTTSSIVGGITFTVGAISLNNATIQVSFNGSSTIDATSGTATVSFATGPASNANAPIRAAAVTTSGDVGHLSAGGLNTQVNTVFPSSMGTEYQSFVRIANISNIDGAATITVYNDNTGASLGSFSTSALTDAVTAGRLGTGGVIKAGSTFQVSAADIEANVSGAAATGASYRVVVTGPFNGYVQAVMWNQDDGIFTDLSGFRNGGSSTNP